jgi:ABC-type sugar transport system permease subunit
MTISAVSARKPRITFRTHQKLAGVLFVLPTVIFFLFFIAYPFFRALGISLTEWAGYDEPRFVGLKNFVNLTRDRVFWISLKNTFVFTVATTVLQTVLPLLVAVLLNAGWRGGIFFRTVFFIPVIVSFLVTALLWRMIYDATFGILNSLLTAVGLDSWTRAWLALPETVLPAIIVVSLWASLGFYMLIFYAGLQGIPTELYEAASMDGANAWQRLLHVTVPLLWPVTTVVMVINIIGGIRVFDVVYVMTTGGPNHASEVLGTYLYVTAFGATGGGSPSMGYAAAIGVVILILSMIGAIIQLRLTGNRADVY